MCLAFLLTLSVLVDLGMRVIAREGVGGCTNLVLSWLGSLDRDGSRGQVEE